MHAITARDGQAMLLISNSVHRGSDTRREPMTMHLALLGDSIFDNAAYTLGGPAVVDQVREHLPATWRTTLVAVDGSLAGDVAGQVRRLPADVTHLALSAGGNDALEALKHLSSPCRSVMESLQVLADLQVRFAHGYRAALRAALAPGRPLLVCTIYDQVPGLGAPLQAALSLFNDAILREAILQRLPVLDLRAVCTEASDYSTVSPIEPSSTGGHKLAGALVHAVLLGSTAAHDCRIFG